MSAHVTWERVCTNNAETEIGSIHPSCYVTTCSPPKRVTPPLQTMGLWTSTIRILQQFSTLLENMEVGLNHPTPGIILIKP